MPAGASLRFFAESDESVIRTVCDGEYLFNIDFNAFYKKTPPHLDWFEPLPLWGIGVLDGAYFPVYVVFVADYKSLYIYVYI